MERESFEDEEVAKLLNDNFIPIKIDKEERPDLNAIYMKACLIMNGNGGWPLNLWLTPEQLPVFGGTYFPKRSTSGNAGLINILEGISVMWKNEQPDIIKNSKDLYNILLKNSDSREGQVKEYIATAAYLELEKKYDSFFGGFSKAPKFPTPHQIIFLLNFYSKVEEKNALTMALNTLDSMYKGGIYDHIGGGFSRYSVDKKWLIPHFEKMLYDNALLIYAYSEAYLITGNEKYNNISKEIRDFILEEMTSKAGGFYTALDADTEGEEGKFYKWSIEEIKEILGVEEAEYYNQIYGITEEGTFGNGNIPNLVNTNIANIDVMRVKNANNKLKEVRKTRKNPNLDNKILTANNSLMIGSLAYMARVAEDNISLEMAEKAYSFLDKELIDKENNIKIRYVDGEIKNEGILDDYAYFIWALIELHQSTQNYRYLLRAIAIQEKIIKEFWDNENYGFFLTSNSHEKLIYRPKEVSDGAIPAGNSVAVNNLLKLSRLTGNLKYQDYFDKAVQGMAKYLNSGAMYHTFVIQGMLYREMGTKDLVISADDNDLESVLNNHRKESAKLFTWLINNDNLHDINEELKSKKVVENKTTFYLCEDFTCNEPIFEFNPNHK